MAAADPAALVAGWKAAGDAAHAQMSAHFTTVLCARTTAATDAAAFSALVGATVVSGLLPANDLREALAAIVAARAEAGERDANPSFFDRWATLSFRPGGAADAAGVLSPSLQADVFAALVSPAASIAPAEVLAFLEALLRVSGSDGSAARVPFLFTPRLLPLAQGAGDEEEDAAAGDDASAAHTAWVGGFLAAAEAAGTVALQPEIVAVRAVHALAASGGAGADEGRVRELLAGFAPSRASDLVDGIPVAAAEEDAPRRAPTDFERLVAGAYGVAVAAFIADEDAADDLAEEEREKLEAAGGTPLAKRTRKALAAFLDLARAAVPPVHKNVVGVSAVALAEAIDRRTAWSVAGYFGPSS